MKACYLPWADLDREAAVGPVRFVPLASWLEQEVTDPIVRRFWERYQKCHIGQSGKPVTSLAMAVHTKAPFGQLTARQTLEIHRAAAALAFAYHTAGYESRTDPKHRRSGMTPIAKPERFALYGKTYAPTDRSATLTSGNVSSHWSLAQLRWQHPPHVMGGSCVGPDREFLVALGKLVRASPRNDLANRIWTALDWVRMAFTGGDGIDDRMRLGLMMTAYECLFAHAKGSGTRGGEVKWAFANFAKQHLQHDRIRHTTRDLGPSIGKQTLSLPADWFYDFFKCRSLILHGKPLLGGVPTFV